MLDVIVAIGISLFLGVLSRVRQREYIFSYTDVYAHTHAHTYIMLICLYIETHEFSLILIRHYTVTRRESGENLSAQWSNIKITQPISEICLRAGDA